MRMIGAKECRIERIVAVNEICLRDDYDKYTPGRTVHCFCFKLAGISRHRNAEDDIFCSENTLLYIPAGVDYHVTVQSGGPSIAVNFHLTEDSLYEPRLKLLRAENPDGMRRLFTSMLALRSGSRPGSQYALYSVFYQLMEMVETQLFNTDFAGLGYRKIEPAIDYICGHLSDPGLSETQLAALCGYSAGYFRRVFSECMGMPPVKYIAEKRMEHAASMLRSGFFTLTEIAAAVGFNNVYYFGTAFKRHYGEPPGRWAKKER